MKLKELTEKEFSEYALHHPQNNFFQTVAWGELKNRNGWKYYFVGLVDDKDNILGASLLLSKKLFGKYNLFYAPRGFLLDYLSYDLVATFTKEIKKYLRTKNAIFIKIDPYVMYKERDINGDLVENGRDNSLALENLKKLGYKHTGFIVYKGNLQSRWMFLLDIENKTEKQILKEVYHQTTRHNINKTLKLSFDIEELTIDKMDEFKAITDTTSKRRGFVDRPLSYYKDMYEVLDKHNMIRVLSAKFNCDKSIETTEKENEKLAKEVFAIKEKYDRGFNKNRILKQILEMEKHLNNNESKVLEYKELKEKYGNLITMSAAMFITYGDEVVYLYSGTHEEFLKYQAPYRIQWEIIKFAINNGYKRYNFYGISGAFDKNDPSYGVYTFKKGFNGYVLELIGEFDLVINKFYYFIYNIAFKTYRKIKKLKHKLLKR